MKTIRLAFIYLFVSIVPFLSCLAQERGDITDVTPVKPVTEPGKYYALLFAVDEYDSWPDLNNPILDAETLKTELEENYGFLVDPVYNATQSEILEKIRDYADDKDKFGPADHLLIFFAGHGIYDEIDGEGYLVAQDSDINDEIRSSYIAHSILANRINNIQSEHILVVLDACFSGTFDPRINRGFIDDEHNLTPAQFLAKKIDIKTRRFITSGGKEYVPDGRPGHHSPFMRSFLETLRSYGGQDAMITFNELEAALENVNPLPRTGEFADNEPGSDFVFLSRISGEWQTTSPDPVAGVETEEKVVSNNNLTAINVYKKPPLRQHKLMDRRINLIHNSISRKLRKENTFQVLNIDKYLEDEEIVLRGANNARYAVILRVEHRSESMLHLDLELHDLAQRGVILVNRSNDVENTDAGLKQFVDGFIEEVFQLLNASPEAYELARQEKVPIYLRRWTIGARSASINRNNEALYLNDGIGKYFELFVSYNVTSRLAVEFEYGRDFGNTITIGETTEEAGAIESRIASTTSRQQNLVAKYDFAQLGPLNFYAGGGGAIFEVGRAWDSSSGITTQAGQITAGGIVLAGVKLTAEKFRLTIHFEPRYIFGGKIKDKVISSPENHTFVGGHAGGFYSIIGIGFKSHL